MVVGHRQAFVSAYLGRVKTLVHYNQFLQSAKRSYPIPAVVVAPTNVQPKENIRASRKRILNRDGYICAYCGDHGNTIDHVVPRCKGGRTTWGNCVACCERCNARKGGKWLADTNLRLRFTPKKPRVPNTKNPPEEWKQFI